MQEVLRALAMARVDLVEQVARPFAKADHVAADPEELVDQFLELTIRFWLARALRP